MRAVQMLMDRDRQRRQQQQQSQPHTADNQNNQQIHSPYSGATRSQVSAHDGRPLMRPITPLKSSQAMRQLGQSTNTSAITSNNQFANNNMQQAENTASIQPFLNEGNGANLGDSPDRNLPSELRHRPKIPRTPNRADRP